MRYKFIFGVLARKNEFSNANIRTTWATIANFAAGGSTLSHVLISQMQTAIFAPIAINNCNKGAPMAFAQRVPAHALTKQSRGGICASCAM